MSLTITLPPTYGYTAGLALGVIPLMAFIQGNMSGICRKAARIAYPTPYATANEAASDPAKHRFNCAQRAHGNLLENMPQTIATLLWTGLFYPTAAPVLGGLWVVCRGIYAYGYIYGKSENGKGRLAGSGFWLCQLGLIGLSLAAAAKFV